MCPLPTDPEARRRLIEAQRAEADALKTVELAARARDRVQKKLDAANGELDSAKLRLVQCSGLQRASALLAIDPSEVRRSLRYLSGPTGTDGQ